MRYETLTQALDSQTSAAAGGGADGTVYNQRTYYAATSRLWREPAQAPNDDADTIDRSLSFDISNNRILASVDLHGVVQSIAVAHRAEPVYGHDGLPGVYVDKVLQPITQPRAFGLRLNGAESWECLPTSHMRLLGGFLPCATFTDKGLSGTLLTFAPIGRRGHARPRAIVMVLRLRNTGAVPVTGAVSIPRVSEPVHDAASEPAAAFGRHDAVALLEGRVDGGRWEHQAFALEPGREWVLAVGLIVGSSAAEMTATLAELRQTSVLVWLNETLDNLGQRVGTLTIAPDGYYAEALTRQVELCRQSVLLGDDDQLAGGFWGSDVNAYPHVWMKDMYYQMLPMCWLDPELCRRAILFFARWGLPPQPWGRGLARFPEAPPVVHSLGNAVSALALAGAYYQATGDRQFFRDHPAVYDYGKQVLQEILAHRHGEAFLFPSMYLSDTDARGDYHTGSNVVVWYAVRAMARLGREIYGDAAATEWNEAALKIKRALYEQCSGQGPLGAQFYEGAYRDGTFVPGHDGEESDLTLAPFYGFCEADEPALLHHAKLALSRLNPYYVSAVDGVRDGLGHGPTAPAFVHVLSGARSESEVEAALERMRWLTDLDGSIWWWPYRPDETDAAHVKRGLGKCGWAAGVYILRFIHDILGLEIDVPARTVRFRPFCPWSAFRWTHLHLGAAQVDLEYRRGATTLSAAVTNRGGDRFDASIELTLPQGAMPLTYAVNGVDGGELVRSRNRYERPSIVIVRPLLAEETLRLHVEWQDV